MTQTHDSPFQTIIGSNSTITMPLLDAKTNGMTTLYVGPEYGRNSFRFYARMPEQDQAETYPAPFQFDRSSITFTPKYLIIQTPMPFDLDGKIYRLSGPDGTHHLSKKRLSRWTPNQETVVYPSLPISMPSLKPGQTVEFDGVSYWRGKGSYARSRRSHTRMPPPPVKMPYPVHFLLMLEMIWLPKRAPRHRVEIVSGSPLGYAQPSPTSTDVERPADFTEVTMPDIDIHSKRTPES